MEDAFLVPWELRYTLEGVEVSSKFYEEIIRNIIQISSE